ncbi:hypothetical protein B0H13DRAFT_2411590 [Mycena leptocephala]|nr:hypothetical protein B0H13DRAFT_2411590 [Mycena leptocephala]
MSSTRSSSPPPANDSDDDDYQNLMSTATPVTTPNRNARKRNADHLGDANDGLPLPSLELSLVRTNGNHLGVITSFAARKRLRPEQLTAVEAFARDPLPVQLGKLYATCLANENTLAKFQAAKPRFEINSALKTNLTRAVNAMLCSSKISQYKGETGKNDILALLCRHRWGNFVVGTEHDRAAMDIIQKFIGDAFTQSRSIIKKEWPNSYSTLRPNDTHTTIYQLTKTIVQKLSGGKVVSIPITPALCARIALMRKWHVKKVGNTVKKSDTDDYWQLIDDDLRQIRESARENTTDPSAIAKRVGRAFSSILDKDRNRHGSNPDEEIPDSATVTDDAGISYQADIDAAIEARNQGQSLDTEAAGGDAEQVSVIEGSNESSEAQTDASYHTCNLWYIIQLYIELRISSSNARAAGYMTPGLYHFCPAGTRVSSHVGFERYPTSSVDSGWILQNAPITQRGSPGNSGIDDHGSPSLTIPL